MSSRAIVLYGPSGRLGVGAVDPFAQNEFVQIADGPLEPPPVPVPVVQPPPADSSPTTIYHLTLPLLPTPAAAPIQTMPPPPSKLPILIGVGVGIGVVVAAAYYLYLGKDVEPEKEKGRSARRNPVGRKSTGPKVGRSPPIVKGHSCLFEMKDGGTIRTKGGMIHDPSGRSWPRASVLMGPFRARVRAATDDEYHGDAKSYLGHTHHATIGVVDMPPRGLAQWEYLGEVDRIFYTRTGRKNPGRYQHPFNKPSALATLVKGTGKVRLYKHGRFMRLQLPRGAQLDNRGYVWP